MKKPTIDEIIARSVSHLMYRPGSRFPNPNALGCEVGMSPNTIRNLLKPNKRPSTSKKGSPTIDTLQKVAMAYGVEVRDLLSPDIERAMREREMYASMENHFKGKGSDGNHPPPEGA